MRSKQNAHFLLSLIQRTLKGCIPVYNFSWYRQNSWKHNLTEAIVAKGVFRGKVLFLLSSA